LFLVSNGCTTDDDDDDYEKAVAKDIEVTSLRAANYIIGQ